MLDNGTKIYVNVFRFLIKHSRKQTKPEILHTKTMLISSDLKVVNLPVLFNKNNLQSLVFF